MVVAPIEGLDRLIREALEECEPPKAQSPIIIAGRPSIKGGIHIYFQSRHSEKRDE